MSTDEVIQPWLRERRIHDVEAFVPDMAGAARGKVIPAGKFGTASLKLPESIFQQTVSGYYIDNPSNVEDRDMILAPDPTTLRTVPWASEPAASIFLDCYHFDGSQVDVSPRAVLRNVLAKFAAKGWTPVVAPEVEFYLLSPHTDPREEAKPPEGRLGWTEGARQPFSIDTMNNFDPFINLVYAYCEEQDIRIDTLSQESGPAQFEINFLHGDAVELADQVFLFKRTVREAAIEEEMHATFLAKPMAEEAGSALHVHQSVVDASGNNIFSTPDGEYSDAFMGYIGGLQKYLPHAMLIMAPYVNSYRRFLNPLASPVNLAWAVDNRTVGLRVPESAPENRRVENRLPGADVNPYLALAATLACGYLGMVEGLTPKPPITGSAYGGDFGLHRHISAAIEAFRSSDAMRSMFGSDFVDLYSQLKDDEYMEFEAIITPWEREILMFNV
ncbi:MAG: glutamine synthetase family protein [Woeseiaceae bacterium]|jgi:glutamine synthetase|nr:glutamine synthetase family protein [Woeseiaceae bacterium]